MTQTAAFRRHSGRVAWLLPFVLVYAGGLADRFLARAQKPAEEPGADLILFNGKVLTFDSQNRTVEAVAVRGDRFLKAGSNAEVRSYARPQTQTIDLGGRLAIPGFVDAHSHTSGVSPDFLDLTAARSLGEIQRAVAAKAAVKPEGEWIVGAGPFMFWRGWDEQRLKEHRLLTRHDLDSVAPSHPVVLMKEAGHAIVVNSFALKLCGITKDTPDPSGQITKDPSTNEPTGILLESAMNLVFAHMPAPTREGRIAAAKFASDQLLQLGVTTVANMSVGEQDIEAFQALYASEKQPMVTTVLCPYVPTTGTPEDALAFIRSWQKISQFGDARLKPGALKVFMDGGITGRAAWFKLAYKDRPEFHGIPQLKRETIFEVARLADHLGWQLHIHACGDAAAELAIDAIEAAQRQNKTTGRRHILTHLYVLSPEMMARIKRLGIVAVLQPNFVYSLGEHMRAALSPEQLEHIIPYRSLLAAGVPVSLSADGLPQNPLYGIGTAVVRKTEAGNSLAAIEQVRVLEALRDYTRTSAFALFEEERRGSIEAGKLADLVVLDRDLLTIPAEQIKDARVLVTLKHGQIAVNRLDGHSK